MVEEDITGETEATGNDDTDGETSSLSSGRRISFSSSKLTAVFDSNLPTTDVPSPISILVPAKTLPTNEDCFARLIDVPTFQYTLLALAPSVRINDVSVEVVTVVSVWKINSALISPCASRVSVPTVNLNEFEPEGGQYIPGVSVIPSRSSLLNWFVHVLPAKTSKILR